MLMGGDSVRFWMAWGVYLGWKRLCLGVIVVCGSVMMMGRRVVYSRDCWVRRWQNQNPVSVFLRVFSGHLLATGGTNCSKNAMTSTTTLLEVLRVP